MGMAALHEQKQQDGEGDEVVGEGVELVADDGPEEKRDGDIATGKGRDGSGDDHNRIATDSTGEGLDQGGTKYRRQREQQ